MAPSVPASGRHAHAPYDSPLAWQTIMHVVTHGIQHRGEAATFLTGYGHSPGELDFDFFLLEQANGNA